ncbi:MAG: hypothetical protein JNL89_13625 [Rhodanobacteraceae bacterium]|jgi:anti-sigma-K factor RskA|nr:hypothetical protein [Rhodanobacteraceae bacterium]
MNGMDLERLEALLDTHGGDLRRWPSRERSAAERLIGESPAARTLLAQAAELDAALDAWTVAPPSPQLGARLQAGYPAPRPERAAWLRNLWRDLGGWRLAGPAFAASLALGAILPTLLDQGGADLPEEDLIAAMQLIDELPELGP